MTSNRLPLPDVWLGIYRPRQNQPHMGRSIEVSLPSVLQSTTKAPSTLVYGHKYLPKVHRADRLGALALSMFPTTQDDPLGRTMQRVKRKDGGPEEDIFIPRRTKFEIREFTHGEETAEGLSAMIDNILEMHRRTGVGDEEGFVSRKNGKVVYSGKFHPRESTIFLYVPEWFVLADGSLEE